MIGSLQNEDLYWYRNVAILRLAPSPRGQAVLYVTGTVYHTHLFAKVTVITLSIQHQGPGGALNTRDLLMAGQNRRVGVNVRHGINHVPGDLNKVDLYFFT